VKFTAHGCVTIRVRVDDAPAGGTAAATSSEACGELPLIFEVVDTGHGISADAQRRLFQPFEQAHSGQPDSKWGGTGLGLSSALRARNTAICFLHLARALLC
jgi:signal transduction histidine kinase